MNDANEILKFSLASTFLGNKSNIIPKHLHSECQTRIEILQAITEKNGNSLMPEKPAKGIKEVYEKFNRLSLLNEGLMGKFDRRELRTLTYALNYREYQEGSIFENPQFLRQCFQLLNRNWKDKYIAGLLDCYLSIWGSNLESFTILSEYLLEKISNYKGRRRLYQDLKSNAKFFDMDKGDLDLGVTLSLLNTPLSEATKHLSLPDHWITYPYFSGVINAYYFEKSKSQLDVSTVDDIAQTLERHSNSTKATETNKLVVSKIICHSATAVETFQNRVKDIAFRLVGDPEIIANWRPIKEASPTDSSTIINARKILNEWITREFINVFFEKCIDDIRRKRFWLQYCKKITAFKVFGPRSTMAILKSDDRISEFVDGRYNVVYSNQEVSAFIIYINNHMLIEFSRDGYAFIAYELNGSNTPDLNSRLDSVDDLRAGHLPLAVRRKHEDFLKSNSEGRLLHMDGTYKHGSTMKWEVVFNWWLNKYVL